MVLYINQKVFSWRDAFVIYDEYGAEKYTAKAELFTWGHRLHVWNEVGVELLYIEQKVLSFTPRFILYIGGMQAAEVVKRFTLFSHKYDIMGPDWFIDGNVWAHEYSMEQDGEQVAYLRRAWMTWGDMYELNIKRPDDELLALGITLAIDCAMCEN